MMKHEFDALVGITTDPECYKKIEAVYMQFDEMFPTKEAIVSFYKKHDMNGIERMYCEALKIQQLEQQLKELRCPVIEGSRGEEMKLTVDELLKNYLQYVGKSVFVYMPEVITSDEYWGTRPAQKKEIVITKVCVNARGVVIMDSHSEEYPLWIFEVYTTENEVDACDVQNKEEDIKGAYKKLEEQKQIAENWREKYNKQVELETKIEFEMPPIFQQCKEDLAKDWTETDIRRREIMKEKRRELPWKEFRKAYSYNQEQE